MNSILIIEDDASYRKSIKLILEIEGFVVRTAEKGADGIAMIREKRPNLILCDIMMPNMDGHSVLKLLKSDSTTADIPFIFLTALGERADVRRGMNEGADEYLSKPFSSEELVAAVTGRLHRFEMIRQRGNVSIFQEEFTYLKQNITCREREILMLVGQGLTSKDIAKRLEIRINTVQVHRANLMRKLDTPNAANLARWAIISELMSSD